MIKPKPVFFLLLGLFLAISTVKAQDIHYTFKIADVNTSADAKPVVAIIRSHFNTEEEPNRYFPAFDPNTHQFDFTSGMVVAESALHEFLLANGYSLIDFEYELSDVK